MKPPYFPAAAGIPRALGLLTALPAVLPLQGAELEFSLLASTNNFALGSDFVLVSDRDGDGVDDLAISDPGYIANGSFYSGAVYLVSSATGTILADLEGVPSQQQSFGTALASLDADGDGVKDLAVGAPNQSFFSGAVWILSGIDDSPLLQVGGPPSSQFGSSLASAGDHNGDGKDDLYVGAPRANGALGSVSLISGADGSILWDVASTQSTSSFGVVIATIGDIDGDSKPDLAVAAPDFRDAGLPVGQVSLIRSSDQAIVATRDGVGFFNRLGASMKAVPDADDDGLPDLMVGSFSGGNAYVLSGADLSVLVDLSIPDHPPFQPLVAGGGVDDDGDGITDWLIASPGFELGNALGLGGYRILSGADGSLLLDESTSTEGTGLGQTAKALPGFGFAIGEPNLVDPTTGGRGAAYVWSIETVRDSDGDGIPDDEDAFPDSITDPTVVLFGKDSGVENRQYPDGSTLADLFAELPDPGELGNQGRYLKGLNGFLKDLQQDGLLSKNESKAIRKAAVSGLGSAKGK